MPAKHKMCEKSLSEELDQIELCWQKIEECRVKLNIEVSEHYEQKGLWET